MSNGQSKFMKPHPTLHWQILAALVLAAICGFLFDEESAIGAGLISVFDFVGDLFLNALKMIIVPLILSTVILGIRNMAREDAFGRVGGKTIGFYLITGAISIFTGLIFVNLIAPGSTDAAPALIAGAGDPQEILDKVEGRSTLDLVAILARMIPENIVAATSSNLSLLSMIFVGVIFGFFMSKLEGQVEETLVQFWNGVHDVMIMITMLIMRFAPLGVLALVGETAIRSGAELFTSIALFFVTVFLALAVHIFVWLPLLLKFVGGINPIAYYSKVVRAQLTAFSTSSSSATLPVTISSTRNAGVSEKISSFVLPLGATVNMDGTALYECVVVIFIAQLYAYTAGVDFTIAQQITVVVLALLTSIGVAGIPSASLVAIALILQVVGLPLEFLGIVLAVDRILDMCRTSVNVTSDMTIAALIARTEGESLPEVTGKSDEPEESEAAAS